LINDIDEEITSKVSLFADDTRILRAVDTEADVEALQADLDRIYSWQEINNMEFNSKKFEVMRYGRNQTLKESTLYLTPNWEDIIEEKESLRDLGVIVSNDASFSNHVEHVCSKVKQKSGWILRTFRNRKSWFLKLMWKALVQPHVDYCSQLYFPHLSTQMQKIENLQQVYTKKIPEVSQLNYWERLKSLRIYSQERRMERYRILYAWKILEGISPNCGLVCINSDRRGREIKIPAIKGKGKIQTLREASFQVHGAKLFNSLPKSIRNLKKISVEEFKSKLDHYLESIPDEPHLNGYVPTTCDQLSGSPSNSILDHARTDRSRRPG
jgi:ribonuclease P/MRP protein subunit RPP40